MRIVYAIENYYPHIGGVETVFQEVAEGMVRMGYTCAIVTSRVPGASTHETLHGVEVYRVWTPPFARRYWYTLCCLPRLIREAKKAHVIHTTTYNAAPAAWIAGKVTRKKVLITVHEVWGNLWYQLGNMSRLSAWAHKTFEAYLLKLRFDWYATVSKFTQDALESYPQAAGRITTVYNGIDERLFSPQLPETRQRIRQELGMTPTQTLFLFFGRPGVSKGVEYLLEAMPSVRRQLPDAKLVMLLAKNPIERYDTIVTMREKLNVQDCVHIMQPVERKHLPEYISAASAVVVPSVSEGFGFSAAETCSVGTPLVTTTAGSLPEVISGIALSVPPQDSEALAKAMVQIIHTPPQALPAKHFAWETTLQGYAELYRTLNPHA